MDIRAGNVVALSYATTIVMALLLSFSSFALNPIKSVYTQSENNRPSINATSLFDTGQMVLPEGLKRLVILIPDEAHHGPGEEDESRFIAQPFVPQNAVVGLGTQVVWYNGDVGHEHNIVVDDNNGNQIFRTGEFTELVASRPIAFNNTGNFQYADTVEYEGGFVMTGNVTVVNQNSSGAADTFDSVGVLMVPSLMVQDVTGQMRNAGFGIDSIHNFKDLRGGQSDTGDEQTLVVWTTVGKSLDGITSQLGEISNSLPYE